MKILDFGCGPGGFSLAAARLVGPRGFVYALDIHPLAVESVRKSAERQGFGNTRAVLGESTNDVPDGQFDMALLYDVLHDLPEPSGTFVELHRVLKDRGVLSVSDRHVREASILSIVTGEGHFRLAQRSPRTFQFDRTETSEATT
ncbi:class I SAM-dependent methyltransferase [Candidatus Sumerlaeota bacterium]|nr:class I SAM-dependent methyltransferase [Candidatus Sumerlaeota bacterium]